MRRHAKDIGVWDDLVRLREKLKLEGMAATEACERAGADLKIEERWQDWRKRKTQVEIMGRGVPITPTEMVEIKPDYVAPRITPGSIVGDESFSLPEQIRWVKQKLARVRNGGDQPTRFPNDDVLYWYQIAITRPLDFDRMVIKLETPDKGADDAWLRDGEYQFAEIEKQLIEAVKEAGKQLVEQEREFAETLNALLRDGAKGAGVELAVSA
jgi:hypothetical protein